MGKLIWIASYPKSGNIWVQLFLLAYAKLKLGPVERLDLNDPGLKALSVQDNDRKVFEPFLDKPWDQATRADFSRARMQAQEAVAAARPGFTPIKSHSMFTAIDGVPVVHPGVTAGALYIVRNPLDVALSVQSHFGVKSVGKAIQMMNMAGARQRRTPRFAESKIGAWREHVESWVGLPRRGIYCLRYEDMLTDPKDAFTKALTLFGEEIDEAPP